MGLPIIFAGDDLMSCLISKKLSVGVLGFAMLLSAHAVYGQRQRVGNGPITINELIRRGVMGKLGHQLGTILTIEGIAADEGYRRERADVGEILLRVQAVNGKRLKDEVVFPFMQHAVGSVTRPTVGSTFKFIGYETGAFVGEPEGVFNYIPRFATTSYHFRTSFNVVKDSKDK